MKFNKIVTKQYRHPRLIAERVWLGPSTPSADCGTYQLDHRGLIQVGDTSIYSTEDVLRVHSSRRFKSFPIKTLLRLTKSTRTLYRNAAAIELINRRHYGEKPKRNIFLETNEEA